jgi:undecaprenyl phosphate N,N'-diacetylbacillosamine 1-phosphate transferase
MNILVKSKEAYVMYRLVIKPLIDLCIALAALLLISPILLSIMLLLLFFNQGKPFFLQRRPGKDGRIFTIIKFKTMNDKKDYLGNLLPDNQRLTKVGSFVRKTSIDELPQLLNVLKGDMSLVGPRPLLPEYLHLYDDFQRKRHNVKPGITGWAQVNGRNAIGWDRKFELDVWYAENVSFILDVRIVLKTIVKVLQRKGISASVLINMEPFKGNKE